MRPVAAVLILLLAAPGAHAAQGWSGDAELGAGLDSNAGNSQTDSDRNETAGVYAGGGVNYEQRLGLHTAVQGRAALSGEMATDVEDLSNARLGLRLRLLHKPGEGFYVPVLAAWAGAGARAYGSAIRDSHEFRGGVYLLEPLTTAVQARVEVSALRRDARGRAFDADVRSAGLNLEWLVQPWLTLYGGVRMDDGDITVSAFDEDDSVEPKTQHRYLEPLAAAIEPDPAFGPGWYAFRVDGRTTIASLGGNVPLGSGFALDLQALRAEAEVEDFTYERWLGSISLLKRF